MDRWSGVLKAPVLRNNNAYCKVAASLCLSPNSKELVGQNAAPLLTNVVKLCYFLQVPSANAIFFNGDRVDGTGNPLIERLSDLQRVAEILVSKVGGSVNAWVVEASMFNGPFAVYKEFIPSVNNWGEPKTYNPIGFPASASTVSLLSNTLEEVKNILSEKPEDNDCAEATGSRFCNPKTIFLGFSKGGTVINQLFTELSHLEIISAKASPLIEEQLSVADPKIEADIQILPNSVESLLNSIAEIHYVDVGLNAPGAYLTDINVIKRISQRLVQGAAPIRVFLHGTPRQWCDKRRVLIRTEKDKLVQLLQSEAHVSEGKLQVVEKLYLADRKPDLQMHFEIIDILDVSQGHVSIIRA